MCVFFTDAYQKGEMEPTLEVSEDVMLDERIFGQPLNIFHIEFEKFRKAMYA